MLGIWHREQYAKFLSCSATRTKRELCLVLGFCMRVAVGWVSDFSCLEMSNLTVVYCFPFFFARYITE